jgi:hypothetical protein
MSSYDLFRLESQRGRGECRQASPFLDYSTTGGRIGQQQSRQW